MTSASAMQTPNLLDSLEALTPLLVEHRPAGERNRRLAPEVATALRDAGYFRMFRPASRGGLQLPPTVAFAAAEALAQIDSAAAWNVQVCNASELYGAWFSDAASAEIFGPAESIVAGAFNPPRRAVPVDGGYRVTGRTSFNSNCHNATWTIGLAHIYDGDGDTPRADDTGEPITLLTALPIAAMEIVDNWNTLGMAGTGSHDLVAGDVLVPAHHAVPFGPLERPAPAYDTPLARLPVWGTVGAHASVALGSAQAALDALVDLGRKVPTYTEKTLRDRPVVQSRLARAEGILTAARSYFYATFDDAWRIAQDRALEMQEKATCQLASTHAVLSAVEVVDLVHSCAGTTAIRQEHAFERHFRDVHVISQHAFLAESRLEAVGQIRFELEPDWGFFYF